MFDKTGTLTAGKPQVTGVTMLHSSISEQDMLLLAAAVERQAMHPIARAVVAAAEQLETSSSGSSGGGGGASAAKGSKAGAPAGAGTGVHHEHVLPGSFQQEPGSGAVALVGGRRVAVGTLEWLQRQGAAVGDAAAQAALSTSSSAAAAAVGGASGVTRVFVAVEGALVGALDVTDQIRSDAHATIAHLHAQGLRTIMLSGGWVCVNWGGGGDACLRVCYGAHACLRV